MIPTNPSRTGHFLSSLSWCIALGTALAGCTVKDQNPVCGCMAPFVRSTFHTFDVPTVVHKSDTLLAVANNPGCTRYWNTSCYRVGDTLNIGPSYDRQSCTEAADTSAAFTLDTVKVIVDSTISSDARFFRFTIGRKGFADSIATVGVTIQ